MAARGRGLGGINTVGLPPVFRRGKTAALATDTMSPDSLATAYRLPSGPNVGATRPAPPAPHGALSAGGGRASGGVLGIHTRRCRSLHLRENLNKCSERTQRPAAHGGSHSLSRAKHSDWDQILNELNDIKQPCHHRERPGLIDSVERPQIGIHAFLDKDPRNCDSPLSSRCDSV